MERPPRNPPDLEIPAFLEIYDSPRPVATRQPREPREHLTRGEREASKVLLALLLCLIPAHALMLLGVDAFRPVTIGLALGAAGLAAALHLTFIANPVVERLLYKEEVRPAGKSRARRLAASPFADPRPVALYFLAFSVAVDLPGPMGEIAWGAMVFGGYALTEAEFVRRPDTTPRFTPFPGKRAYTHRTVSRRNTALFSALTLIFVAGALLVASRASVSIPAPLPDALPWLGDAVRGFELPRTPADLRGALTIRGWLVASIVAAIKIALVVGLFRTMKLTPATDSPLAAGPGSGRSPTISPPA